MVTIKDVAKHAGVSTATASRALRNIGYIDKTTYEKVLKASRELGYVPNATAQQLKNNTVKTVGFIVSDINNEYYMSILSDIKKMLDELGFNFFVAFSSENPVDEEKSFRALIASRVCAILFTPVCNTNGSIIRIAKQNGIKVIQLFRNIYSGISSIINDDEDGCYCAAKYLLENKFKRLLLVDVDYAYLDFKEISPNRSVGFMKALMEASADAEYEIINFPLVDYDISELTSAVDRVQPDAVITATNRTGLEILSYIRKNNKKIKLVSFDDNEWLEFCGISAIRQNMTALTKAICGMISDDGATPQKETIPQILVIRQ